MNREAPCTQSFSMYCNLLLLINVSSLWVIAVVNKNCFYSYYINYLTKAMQLEDPRIRYRQLQNERASNESIPMQVI